MYGMIQNATTIRVQAEDFSVNMATSRITSVVTITTVRTSYFAKFLGALRNFGKSAYYLRHVCQSASLSICPHGTTGLPLEGIS